MVCCTTAHRDAEGPYGNKSRVAMNNVGPCIEEDGDGVEVVPDPPSTVVPLFETPPHVQLNVLSFLSEKDVTRALISCKTLGGVPHFLSVRHL